MNGELALLFERDFGEKINNKILERRSCHPTKFQQKTGNAQPPSCGITKICQVITLSVSSPSLSIVSLTFIYEIKKELALDIPSIPFSAHSSK
ncbi:hypothetical protein NPIL_499241 [Nephila pilipes]|uniref:Uncharacterized protein n=1 Tax=Nephila pilipes TaxID=299642 RepID=A0A8X6MWX1_NEPPI|nr:hypothetical protein NPIL_499241 [Nephila pilipes]